jgi:thiol-disulfide isomerase/thioredoxin
MPGFPIIPLEVPMLRKSLMLTVLLALAALPAAAQTEEEAGASDVEKRLEALEQRLTALEAKIDQLAQGPALEQAASGQLSQIRGLAAKGQMEEAQKLAANFQKQYGRTDTARKARSFLSELAVVGRDAPTALDVEKWYTDGSGVNLAEAKATLFVFWEEWCPHCRREVPKMKKLYENYHDDGLEVVGLTKLTRGVTEEKVLAFIEQNQLTYPIAKEKGDLSQQFAVSGIPAAAVVKDGKIVWRGHPARLTDDMLKGFLGLAAEGEGEGA